MNEQDIAQCIDALGCRREGFPQTYLSLPLSNENLRLSVFTPYIAKTDKYLAGWRATLLNHMGRATLVNSVLDSQLNYIMCALPLPPGVLLQINKRRRAFHWTGTDQHNGVQHLVAWENVCDTKAQGGLGIKDLGIQNTCLL